MEFVFGGDGGSDGRGESGGGALEEDEEVPLRGGEGGDVEVDGLDDEVAGGGGED